MILYELLLKLSSNFLVKDFLRSNRLEIFPLGDLLQIKLANRRYQSRIIVSLTGTSVDCVANVSRSVRRESWNQNEKEEKLVTHAITHTVVMISDKLRKRIQ